MIAGLAYELIRYAGKHQGNRVLMTLLAPGLWLQRLTTREPSLDQIEVSIRALQEVMRVEQSESEQELKPRRASRSWRRSALAPVSGERHRMPRIVREADVSWEGNVARGTGSISAALLRGVHGARVLGGDAHR